MKKRIEPEFVVTDRRRFTSEGEEAPAEAQVERPQEMPETQEPAGKPQEAAPAAEAPAVPEPAVGGDGIPSGEPIAYDLPSAEERKTQEDAFRASADRVELQINSALSGGRAQDLQMSFERFVASIYMSALLQLGLMREQGGPPPPVDLMGARQTIDTLAILADKTKGNLTAEEENLLQNCLYELRMAYVEVTNALARPPQPGGPSGRQ